MGIDRLTAIIALGALLAGCAATAPKPDAGVAEAKEAGPALVRVTGSRIPQPADRVEGGNASTVYPLYVVDRDELWNTGATSVGDGLRHLPFVRIHR